MIIAITVTVFFIFTNSGTECCLLVIPINNCNLTCNTLMHCVCFRISKLLAAATTLCSQESTSIGLPDFPMDNLLPALQVLVRALVNICITAHLTLLRDKPHFKTFYLFFCCRIPFQLYHPSSWYRGSTPTTTCWTRTGAQLWRVSSVWDKIIIK